MPHLVRRTLYLCLAVICACSLQAQDAALALSTSVGYNTQRASLKMTPEQATEAERLGKEATAATRAGNYGEALRDYAHGIAVMHNVEWTPGVELASALRGKLSHAIIEPGQTTVSLSLLYPVERPEAKLGVSVVVGDKTVTTSSVTPAKPFEATVPVGTPGDYTVEVRLTEPNGAAPQGLPNGVFAKSLPLHVEALNADAQHLRDSLAKLTKRENPALPSAEYTLALYERADKGEVNPRLYNFKKEFATAQNIVDTIQAGKDPFAGKKGDFRKAYRSNVDQTLQPYRLFVPDAYQADKANALIVALHGMGGDENGMFDGYGKELPVVAQKHGYIVVAPKGRGPAAMYRGNAEQDVMDVLAEVERDYKIDRARIYLMGHSMGGYGTWSVAIDHPDIFAALGPISGGGDVNAMVKIKDIPQYVTHGDNDPTVNVRASRDMVAAGKAAGAPITYVEIPGGTHGSVVQGAFAPMLDFFDKHPKPNLY